VCEGWLIASAIADRKIGKSAPPSGAGGEGPQKHFFLYGLYVLKDAATVAASFKPSSAS
jgi:hypothetical protein